MRKEFCREVWVMWRDRHGLSPNRLLSLGDWLAAFGLIPFVIAAIYNDGKFARPLLVSLAGICLFVVIASIFRAAKDVWNRDTTKLPLISEQKGNPAQFVSSRYSHLRLRNNRQLDVEIEWFNGTIFELEFGLTTGMVKINNLDSKVQSVDSVTCYHGRHCSYVVTLTDKDILDVIREAIANNTPVKLYVVLHSKANITYENDGKPQSTQQFNPQCLIDNIAVVPETV